MKIFFEHEEKSDTFPSSTADLKHHQKKMDFSWEERQCLEPPFKSGILRVPSWLATTGMPTLALCVTVTFRITIIIININIIST